MVISICRNNVSNKFQQSSESWQYVMSLNVHPSSAPGRWHRPQVPITNSSLLREPSHCQQLLHLCLSGNTEFGLFGGMSKIFTIPFWGFRCYEPSHLVCGFSIEAVYHCLHVQVNCLEPNLAIQPEKPWSGAENNLQPNSAAQSP